MKTCFRASAFLAVVLLAACNVLPPPQTDSVRYFTLGSPAGPGLAQNSTVVRPVQLAGHLHGRKLAVRVSEHEVSYLEDVRWAEPLQEAITQSLRNRLGTVAGGATVTVQVERCELNRAAGNKVELTATYLIVPVDGDRTTGQHGLFSATPRAWDGKDYGALVDLMHTAVGELGDAIAAALPERK